MARITPLDLSQAKSRLKDTTARYSARAPYREAIANLSAGRMLQLEPDPGESMRGLKLNITMASKEVSRPVEYGVSPEGTLLVWLQDTPKRARRVKTA